MLTESWQLFSSQNSTYFFRCSSPPMGKSTHPLPNIYIYESCLKIGFVILPCSWLIVIFRKTCFFLRGIESISRHSKIISYIYNNS
jgi:hypothetical protein